ncbi:hypothetical protein EGT74_25920 [Chitinophaga lutea]|uniref:Uncharacterized protein n=1 Tax=Chitinophaga lutea TaxID=2488634 RepID=A0A3N4PAZ5_9BACT|nr:hypothetical protein [Chitinophaga lutea]RPE05803.1 hypothetical protein EGT74_25920 [Chitinophaga lutea]
MVTIKNYQMHVNAEGKLFISLELIGDAEIIQSKETGRFYVTAKKCFVPSTFDEITAKLMIGKEMAGNIVKKECSAYEYRVPGTGEIISLSHQYEYVP